MYKKTKKIVAIILATTMVMGSSMIASAETSGSAVGTGSNEGHLETKSIDVVLPVLGTNYEATAFNYIIDPEGLIQDTSGAKHSGDTFPDKASDTRVYFGTTSGGATTYANTSKTLEVTNKSSVPVKLTVSVATETTDGAISLVDDQSKAAYTDTVTSPALYLGLQIVSGSSVSTPTALEVGKTVKQEIEIAGKEANFVKTVSGGAYAYVVSGSPTNWDKVGFNLTGSVSHCSAQNSATKAEWKLPKVTVTWKYEDASAEAETVAPSTAKTTFSKTANGTGVDVIFNPGSYTGGITAVKWSAENSDSAVWKAYSAAADYYTINDNTLSVKDKIFTSSATRYWRVYFADDVYVTLTFTVE